MDKRPSDADPGNDVDEDEGVQSVNELRWNGTHGYSIAAQAMANRSFRKRDTMEGTNRFANA